MRRVLVTEVEFPGEEWTRGLKTNVLRIDAAERHRDRKQPGQGGRVPGGRIANPSIYDAMGHYGHQGSHPFAVRRTAGAATIFNQLSASKRAQHSHQQTYFHSYALRGKWNFASCHL